MDKEQLQKAVNYAKENPKSQFANELRRRIETGQIDVASFGVKAKKQADNTTLKQRIFNGLDKTENFVDKTIGKASDFLFGSTSKAVGSMITDTIGEGSKLAGIATNNKKAYEFGNKLISQAEENFTPTNIGFTALETYPGGGTLTKLFKKMPGGESIAKGFSSIIDYIPEKLREKAVKQYSEALNPTTKELKKKTEKVVPDLLDNKVTGSLESIKTKSGKLADDAGEAVGKAEDGIIKETTTETKGFLDELAKKRNEFIVDGKVVDEAAVKAYDDTSKIIEQYGDNISSKSLIQVRRILDKSVAKLNKNFTKDEGLTLATEAREGLANAIRAELNKEFPDLAKANSEFSFWKDVNRIVSATIERKSSQTGILQKSISASGGAIIAGSQGDGVGDKLEKALFGGILGASALRLFSSPQYKTISAVEKNKLANFIADGKIEEYQQLINRLLAGIKNSTDGE